MGEVESFPNKQKNKKSRFTVGLFTLENYYNEARYRNLFYCFNVNNQRLDCVLQVGMWSVERGVSRKDRHNDKLKNIMQLLIKAHPTLTLLSFNGK